MNRAIVLALMGVLFLNGSIVYAVDPELSPRLGIPSEPKDFGDTYGKGVINGGMDFSLGSCSDIGINTSYQNVVGMASSAMQNAKGLAGTAAMAALAYFMPTEYSVVANISSMAEKYLGMLSDRCKTYRAARDYLEKKDMAGTRKASYAKCLERYGPVYGDSVEEFCSNPKNAWYALTGTTGCISVMDKVLSNVERYPEGVDKRTLVAFFGDVTMCADSSSGVPATITIADIYTAIKQYYGPAVDNAVAAAKTRYLSSDDVRNAGLCVGASRGDNRRGVICPSSEVINMLPRLPQDEQILYKNRLVDDLSTLDLVYRTYSMSTMTERAAATSSQVTDTESIKKLVDVKEKEVEAYIKTLNMAQKSDGDLKKWEAEVMERNRYWIRQQQNVQRARAHYEPAYESKGNTPMDEDIRREILEDIKRSNIR